MAGFRLRMRGAAAPAPSSNLPATQTINWGAKTRTGYGAHLLAYEGAGTLSIVSQKDASNADVTIWQMGQNALSWKGASANYSTAPPASLNGPYTVVVTDGTDSSTVTINVVANAAHIREMTSVANGGRWATDSMYTIDGTTATGGVWSFQIGAMLEANTPSYWVTLGDTIWCRDGVFNPQVSAWDMSVRAAASRGGTGELTIRSETVDATVDANGYPYNRHGFQIGRLSPGQNGTAGVTKVVWQDIYFCNNSANMPTNALGILTYIDSATGFRHVNCGFETGPNGANAAYVGGMFRLLSDTATSGVRSTIESCTFRNMAHGTTALTGNGFTLTGNLFDTLLDTDCMQGNTNSYDFIILDNVALNCISTTGGHTDFFQHLGITNGATYPFGQMKRNIAYKSSCQMTFLNDTTSGFWDVGTVDVENNICIASQYNLLYVIYANSPVLRWNTYFSPESASPITGQFRLGGGTGGTVTRNIANSYQYNLFSAQTVTATPDPQTTLALSTAAYQAAFPGYVDPVDATDFSLAALKSYVTPDATWFAANNQAGALKPDGSWNDNV